MHREYKRIASTSEKAVLFIHGIWGTPNHFSELLPLVPENVSVHNILLDGHGKGVKDFSKASMQKWQAQVSEVVNELAQMHEEIYIAAHSLGALLAIEQAVRNLKITKLFLLAVPLKLCLTPKMFINSAKVYFGIISNEQLMAAQRCCGITHDKNILLYLRWLPRFMELFSRIRTTRKLVSSVKIPCVACQSQKDEMVSVKAQKLLKNTAGISLVRLENSGHYYYGGNDGEVLKQSFVNVFF